MNTHSPLTIEDIKKYMDFRSQKFPNAKSAFEFAITEWSELLEELSVLTEQNKARVRAEFGDVYQMLQIACELVTDKPLEKCMFQCTHGEDLIAVSIILGKILDGFLRMEAGWVRNNADKQVDLENLFGELFYIVDKLSKHVTGTHLCVNLLEKWFTKGYAHEDA